MNGFSSGLLLWLLNFLLGLLLVVVGFAVKLHIKSDDEHRARIDKEIERIRQRLHDALNDVAGLKAIEHLREIKK